jgi:tripartite-type tricarboxylate transporter receptor subunit TctC
LAISGPAGMPRELQMTLNRQIAEILSRPKVVEVLKQELIEPIPMSPQELTAFIKSEIAKWTPIVASIGLPK